MSAPDPGTLPAGRHNYGAGLSLLVSAAGSRSWSCRVTVAGSQRSFGLGPWPKDAMLYAVQDASPGTTIHGLRTSFRCWAADTGVDRVEAEMCLAHQVGSAVERAYMRSDLLERRRPVMQARADFVLPPEAP